MLSLAQTAANRENAVHSTGPRTEEGKSRSAANATSHGLSSAFRVVPHEDQDEFQQMFQAFQSEFNLATAHENCLVDQMAHARWKLARIQRLESRMFELMLDPGDPDSALAARMLDGGANACATLQRYATAAERSYYKAHREFMDSRKDRAQTEVRQAAARAKQTHSDFKVALATYMATPAPHRPLNVDPSVITGKPTKGAAAA